MLLVFIRCVVIDSLVQKRKWDILRFTSFWAWSCLEKIILKNVLLCFLILLSLLMRIINDYLLYFKYWLNVGEAALNAFGAFFHTFYSMHIFLTAGWICEKNACCKTVKVKIKEWALSWNHPYPHKYTKQSSLQLPQSVAVSQWIYVPFWPNIWPIT